MLCPRSQRRRHAEYREHLYRRMRNVPAHLRTGLSSHRQKLHLFQPAQSTAVIWTQVTANIWSAARVDGVPVGGVTAADRPDARCYAAHSTDHTVSGAHHSLDAARSQIEAHDRWIRSTMHAGE